MAITIHPTACVDEGAAIGDGTSIWHFTHVSSSSQVGSHCSIGQNVYIANGVSVGDHVKIQNNVSLYTGVELEDFVFCGPSCVFTNVINPRSEVPRRTEYRKTRVGRGATIGANATILCGINIGQYALIAAAAVVTADVPRYALMVGVPARQVGWFSRHGQRLEAAEEPETWICPQSGWRYRVNDKQELACSDWPEDRPLSTED